MKLQISVSLTWWKR